MQQEGKITQTTTNVPVCRKWSPPPSILTNSMTASPPHSERALCRAKTKGRPTSLQPHKHRKPSCAVRMQAVIALANQRNKQQTEDCSVRRQPDGEARGLGFTRSVDPAPLKLNCCEGYPAAALASW